MQAPTDAPSPLAPTDRPVPASPSQPVEDNQSAAAAVVAASFQAAGRVQPTIAWPPASSGAAAPPGKAEYVPTVTLPQKRQAPGHLQNKASRSSQIPGWTPTHVFTSEDATVALQKVFVMVEAHADLLDNVVIEAGCLNASINAGSNEAYNNTRLMVSQVRDETARHLQQVKLDMTSLTPEAATLHLQGVLG